MEQNRSRLLLRKIFGFRLFFFVVSVLILYLRIRFELWNDIDEKGWIIGVAGSTFVWSMVELVDFFVRIYEQYCKERIRFWVIVEASFSDVEKIIKVDLENISWRTVYSIIKDLQSEAAKFPFENGIYTCSKEFHDSYYYIENLMYKLLGCFSIEKLNESQEIPLNSESYNFLKETFILIRKEKAVNSDLKDFLDDLKSIKENMRCLAEMKVSFEKQDIVYQHMSYGCEGRLKDSTDINNVRTLITLKPHYVLEKKMLKEQKHSNWDIVYTVLELMYCNGYFDEFLQRKINNNKHRLTY